MSYPANVMPLIYDKSLIEMIKGNTSIVQPGAEDRRFAELETMRVKMGWFKGLSGKWRIGIDREEIVEGIKKREAWRFW